jgi:uncharacterized membrane-anchored protein YitT (DUF2179 family)
MKMILMALINIPMYLLVAKLVGNEPTMIGYFASLGLGSLLMFTFAKAD